MIHFINGDISKISKGIIAHQVNILGVANSGVVSGIKNAFTLWYQDYKELCNRFHHENPNKLLGQVQYFTQNGSIIVANMFSQFSIKPFNRNTDINAFKACLMNIKQSANKENIYIPYKVACVRGGMDWEAEIYPIIEELFAESEENIYIVHYIEGLPIE